MGRFWKAAGGGAAGRATAAVDDGGLWPVIVPGVEPATAELAAGTAAAGEDDGGDEGAIVLTDMDLCSFGFAAGCSMRPLLRPSTTASSCPVRPAFNLLLWTFLSYS